MMLVVAILAAALGLEVMRRRRSGFGGLATDYAASQVASEEEADLCEAEARQFRYHGFFPAAESFAFQEVLHRERAKYFGLLAKKYREAARFPWLPVEPDPPERE
jgi:hypothetical protein